MGAFLDGGSMKLPWLDLLALGVITWFVIRTAWVGFLRGLSSLLGLILGFAFAGRVEPFVRSILAPWFETYPWFSAACWIIAFGLVFLSVFVLAEILTRLVEAVHLTFFDRLLGGLLGFVKACLFLSVIFFFLVTFYPGARDMIAQSRVTPLVFKTTRILIELVPPEWKHKFNYHWRKYFSPERREV